jgi:hypothetical protein
MSEKQNVYVVLEDRNIEKAVVHNVFDNRNAAEEYIDETVAHGRMHIEHRELRSGTVDRSQQKLGQ